MVLGNGIGNPLQNHKNVMTNPYFISELARCESFPFFKYVKQNPHLNSFLLAVKDVPSFNSFILPYSYLFQQS